MVSVTENLRWYLGVSHRDWRLRQGETIQITLIFNGKRKFEVQGEAFDKNFIRVAMPDDSLLIDSFRRAHGMVALAKGARLGFELTTTSRLLAVLAVCAKNNRGRTQSTLMAAVSPPATAAKNEWGGLSEDSTPSDAQPNAATVELQMEAIQLATNFILATRLSNPKVLNRAETPVAFASFGAAWKSDEAVGAVKIVPPDGGKTNGLDVAAAIAADDSRSCKSKFASGRVSELIDSEVVFRGFSSCDDSDGARTAQYFIVPRKGGGFIIFSVGHFDSVAEAGSPPLTSDENLEGFQKAALRASQ